MDTDTLVSIDYPAIAKQIVKLSDLRLKAQFVGHSLVQTERRFSLQDSRYYAVTALIATTIDPKKAGAVTKKLLAALDDFQVGMTVGMESAAVNARREVFVAEFLRFEFGG
jgi:hypothetical protein